jgi:hypothetical protein
MQKQRDIHGWTGVQVAKEFGCHPSHISRVERGYGMPSRELVNVYEQLFDCEGMLLSLYEVAVHNEEQNRRRVGGHRPALVHAVKGDASTFVSDTVPHGTLFAPGEIFTKTWTIRNIGSVPWEGRQLERQGPLTGPGLISSLRYVPIPDARPGQEVEIATGLKAPTYDCTSIAYFKMVHADGRLAFPETYQLGLDLLVRISGQLPDRVD